MQPNRRWCLSLLAGLALGLGPAVPVEAQQVHTFASSIAVSDGGGFGGGENLGKRNLDRYAKTLALTPDQDEAAKALLDGYQAESRDASSAMQKEMESAFAEFQDSQDHDALQKATGGAQRKHSERAAALEKAFFGDLKMLLTPDQEARWGLVERTRRREKGLASGSLRGESVDLTQVVEELNLDPASLAAIAESMEQYEADIDRAIQARDAAMEGILPKDDGPGLMFDFAKMQEAMAKAREAGAPVRDVNQTHQRRLEVLLPEERRADFALGFKKRCFPEVYRATGASRSLRAAASMGDLTPDQKAQIDEVLASYTRESEPANDAWADALVADEESGKDGAIAVGGSVMRISFGDETGPVADARKARKALDEKAKERLESILTPEQRERLPAESAEPEGAFVTGGEAVIIQR
jgi:Spy/CpxP family protein refolding chaperone